ncbi:MAG: imidazole glycerol phosphate synthase subunit HisH [Lachnospiraceae bacterium]|nr:imidazole glycerol phosphate synthase subunit HisH [Lachnospiraceae bacterium]
MIAIIDYGAGNIKSVEKAIQALGKEVQITPDPEQIRSADHVILPGVGAFGDTMKRLTDPGLDEVIREVVSRGTPFLGICLGLQLLFDSSEESPGVPGLGILKGRIRRLPEGDGRKIPQIGWNDLTLQGDGGRLYAMDPSMKAEPYVYFVHSYYLEAEDPGIVTATCSYGATVHASIESGNVFACQFHPEKSSSFGMQMLYNFVNI